LAEEPLHVIFGTGQVGLSLAARLAASGTAVRSVSRHRPAALADGADWRLVDATDPEATADAAKGASVVYQCLNAPYNKWPELFPPLPRNVLRAAEHADALLVAMENLYGYGPTGGKPMTEDLPLAAHLGPEPVPAPAVAAGEGVRSPLLLRPLGQPSTRT
jgi:nucleoside-diphosphate-sugar epimerase